MPDPRAYRLLQELDGQRKELSADGNLTIDDLLAEALESGAYEEDLLNEAIAIRLEQLGIAETPDEKARRDARWAELIKNEEKRTRTRRLPIFVRVAAAVLVGVIALSGLTVGAAYAFNWQFVIRALNPVAESLGFSRNVETSIQPVDKEYGRIIDEQFNQSDTPPSHLLGYPVRLSWVPDRLSLSGWTEFENADRTTYVLQYQGSEEEFLTFEVTALQNDEMANLQLYEKDSGSGQVYAFAGQEVVVSSNLDVLNASWADGQCYYNLAGLISQDELVEIITKLYGG